MAIAYHLPHLRDPRRHAAHNLLRHSKQQVVGYYMVHRAYAATAGVVSVFGGSRCWRAEEARVCRPSPHAGVLTSCARAEKTRASCWRRYKKW